MLTYRSGSAVTTAHDAHKMNENTLIFVCVGGSPEDDETKMFTSRQQQPFHSAMAFYFYTQTFCHVPNCGDNQQQNKSDYFHCTFACVFTCELCGSDISLLFHCKLKLRMRSICGSHICDYGALFFAQLHHRRRARETTELLNCVKQY